MGKGGEASEEAPVRVPVRGMGKGAGEQGGRTDEKGCLSSLQNAADTSPSVLSVYAPVLPPLTPLQVAKSGKSLLGWGKVDRVSGEANQPLQGSTACIHDAESPPSGHKGYCATEPHLASGNLGEPAENSSSHYLLSHQKTRQSCLKVTGTKPRTHA